MHLSIRHVFFILAIISGNVLAQGSISSSGSFSIVSRPSLGPGPITTSNLASTIFPTTISAASVSLSTVSVSASGTVSGAPGSSTGSGASPTSTAPSSSATPATSSTSAPSVAPSSGALSNANGPAAFMMMMMPLALYLGVL